jgi:tetratricopeptide (TPR) repeat protein
MAGPPRKPDDDRDWFAPRAPASDDTTLMPGLDEDATSTSAPDSGARPLPPPGAEGHPEMEDVEVFVSTLARAHSSGAYASLVAGGEPSLVPDEEPVGALFEALPEMGPEIWQAGVRALINVPEEVEPPWFDEEHWRDLGGMYMNELGLAGTPAERQPLIMAAVRVAERLGDGDMALRLCDDALSAAPAAPEAWRARGRLLEIAGDVDGAHEAWRRLGGLAPTDEERAFYTGLDAEWTLARRGSLDGLEGPAPAVIPDGPARALAEAEMALLRGTPADAASPLEQAAFGAGGPVGAALMEAAAQFYEVAGDAATAAEQRFVAARMDPGGAPPPLGRLRDAARQDPGEAQETLLELRAQLPPSALADAISRWAASLARARGDADRAREILAGTSGATPSAPLIRDRLDLAAETGIGLLAETGIGLLDAETRLLAAAGRESPAVLTLLAVQEATARARVGDIQGALARLKEATLVAPDALLPGLVAEELARASADPALRVAGFELWLGVDPARRAPAALALAEAALARGGEGSELAARAALQTAIEAAPFAATFWTTAVGDARAGRVTDAAATLGFGAELWADSRLGAPLAERAAELSELVPSDVPLSQMQGLASAGPSELERLLTLARAVTRAGSSADMHAWLTDQVGVLTDVEARGWWWIRRAQALPASASDERLGCLEAALAKVPGHPVGLALLMSDPAVPASRVAAALAAAATATESPALRFWAVHEASWSGLASQALELVAELDAGDAGVGQGAELRARLAWLSGGAAAASGVIAHWPALDPAGRADDAQALRVVEALETVGDSARAVDILDRFTWGPLAADARRARARLAVGSPGSGLPEGVLGGAVDEEADDVAKSLARLRRAAEQGRFSEVIWALEKEPPHEAPGGGATLYLAALLDEGRGTGERAAAILAAAPLEGPAWGLARAMRTAELAGEGEVERVRRAEALERAAALVGEGGVPERVDPRSAAAWLRRAAHERQVAGDAAAGEQRLREAVAADPEHLPSVVAVRRAAARRRDLPGTVEACAWEAGVTTGPEARVRALLRGAELARHDDSATAPPPNRHVRALGLFRQALDIDPSSEPAFAGLRALLKENAAHDVLADALAARVAVARNPFEITALRLARAELLAGNANDRRAAKIELDTILQKEPQHPRALARLSDLEYDDGAFGPAGELYLRRAIVERAPDVLREILLRLGRIYTRHVPDAKRAIGAYARVLQSEPDNHEALSALSDLYVETGETRNALGITETLIDREPDARRKVAALIRGGQLAERVGDLRQAGARLRQAADEAPRDASAVTELARFLERTRDPVGRRALLDHAVGLLRHDVERGRFDLGTLQALVPLLQARGKERAAAAAAQLCAAISDQPSLVAAEAQMVSGWAAPPPRGRRLAALARPEVDERTFPPALLPGMRHVFRLVGPLLAKGAADLARHRVARGDRVARGQPARDMVDGVAMELGVADVHIDVFVREAKDHAGVAAAGVRVEPGDRPAIIFASQVPALGGRALRFAAARALRLVATHLDVLLAGTPADAGALLGGVVRQFIPDFRHPEVRDVLLQVETERIAKLLPRKLKQDVMPFAVESAGAFDLDAVYAAVRDGANAVGLLAAGDLAAALAVVLVGTGGRLEPGAIAQHAEALSLLRFALSDDYDELAAAME